MVLYMRKKDIKNVARYSMKVIQTRTLKKVN